MPRAYATLLKQNGAELTAPFMPSAFAPEACLGEDFMGATWDDVKVAIEISTYSLKLLADAVAPLMTNGGSIVALDFDATVTWPAYNWMGVAKAALESTNRYLARELGPAQIRCNLSSRRADSDDGGQVNSRVSPLLKKSGTTAHRSAGMSETPAP